jgi:aspartyl-tRNA synthetase
MLHRYPLGIRPFYTMPCKDDERYSCSFDIFIRGEEIISGAQVGAGVRIEMVATAAAAANAAGDRGPLACHALRLCLRC